MKALYLLKVGLFYGVKLWRLPQPAEEKKEQETAAMP